MLTYLYSYSDPHFQYHVVSVTVTKWQRFGLTSQLMTTLANKRDFSKRIRLNLCTCNLTHGRDEGTSPCYRGNADDKQEMLVDHCPAGGTLTRPGQETKILLPYSSVALHRGLPWGREQDSLEDTRVRLILSNNVFRNKVYCKVILYSAKYDQCKSLQ